MLFINPLGGLANRMRVIASAISFVQNFNMPIRCLWWINNELGASFFDLFEPITRVKIFNIKEYHIGDNDIYKKVVNKTLNCIYGIELYLREKDYAKLVGDVTESELEEVKKCILPLLDAGKNVRINTCSILSGNFGVDMFKPVASLQHQIDDFSRSFSDKTYGIHIRRTDNTWAIENSPLELFVKKIDEIISDDPASKFYLATDDAETIDVLKGKFGDRILVREKDFSRATENGIRDAVVDIWLLSKTKKIYGSYYSSFSEMASWIGGIDLEIQKSKQ